MTGLLSDVGAIRTLQYSRAACQPFEDHEWHGYGPDLTVANVRSGLALTIVVLCSLCGRTVDEALAQLPVDTERSETR